MIPKVLPLTAGSVIQLDSLLMRTRFDNWVSDAGFIVTDAEIQSDVDRGYDWSLIFDAGDPE